MARHRRKKRIARSSRVRASQHRFAQAVDKCIVVASKASAGTRMRALGKCVKRTL